MYRVALKVLNPSLDPSFDRFSQLDWLQHHASGEGVDNVLLWLGANNALGTVIALKIKPTPPDLDPPPHEAVLCGPCFEWLGILGDPTILPSSSTIGAASRHDHASEHVE